MAHLKEEKKWTVTCVEIKFVQRRLDFQICERKSLVEKKRLAHTKFRLKSCGVRCTHIGGSITCLPFEVEPRPWAEKEAEKEGNIFYCGESELDGQGRG